MRPLTIYLDDFVSSRDQQYRTWSSLDVLNEKYADLDTILDNIDEFALDYKSATGSDDKETNELIELLSKDPTRPPLLLDCDGKNVLSINVNKSMINGNQTVWVNDRAKCMLNIKDTMSFLGNEPIL